jgi:hypothetical protein
MDVLQGFSFVGIFAAYFWIKLKSCGVTVKCDRWDELG